MKEGLELLYTLQQQDDKIARVENILKEIPIEIKKLEKERDDKANIAQDTRNKLEQNKKKREELEKQILQTKEKIKNKKEQLNKATTNKEYQGFITEIKYEEASITSIEEKIIEKMVESDEIMQEIRENESEYNKIAKEYNKKIKDFTTDFEYQKLKLKKETKNKVAIQSKVPEKLLKIYNKLFTQKSGKAVSYVETYFCEICNMKIRPQLLSEIISNKKVITCENCGRILFKKIEEENNKDQT